MKNIFLFILLSVHSVAFADLAQRTHLEDLIRERAQNTVKLFEPGAQAYVQIQYKDFKGQLPGGLFQVPTGVPSNPDVDDIRQVIVTVYSTKDKASEGVEQALFSALGLPKSVTKIEFKKWDVTPPIAEDRAVTTQSLSKVADDFLSGLGNKLWLSVFLMGAAMLGSAVVLAWLRTRDVRQQTKELVAAAQAQSSARENFTPQQAAAPAEKLTAPDAIGGGEADRYLANLNFDGLSELFGDCYWCEADGYAHFIWRSLPVSRREELLGKIDFMPAYVAYFFSIRPLDLGVHEHPYYLNPAKLLVVAQADLKTLVEKTPAMWLKLSPLRQQKLEIGLTKKMASATGKLVSTSMKIEAKPSPARILPVSADFGDPSIEDEVSLFNNPDVVPEELRPRVRSLVWLALRDDALIAEALAGFDARSLAQAWIGPAEVLARLEKCVNPSKLEILKEYALKQEPSRRSPQFTQLVQAGLRPTTTKSNNEKVAA